VFQFRSVLRKGFVFIRNVTHVLNDTSQKIKTIQNKIFTYMSEFQEINNNLTKFTAYYF
jgi:hypothetical protein